MNERYLTDIVSITFVI